MMYVFFFSAKGHQFVHFKIFLTSFSITTKDTKINDRNEVKEKETG